MANVLHRTTKEYLISVNTPDYPEANWLINPDVSSVRDQPNRYWKIVDDAVVLQSPEEMAATDAAMPKPEPELDIEQRLVALEKEVFKEIVP